jgi:hypothetical protein
MAIIMLLSIHPKNWPSATFRLICQVHVAAQAMKPIGMTIHSSSPLTNRRRSPPMPRTPLCIKVTFRVAVAGGVNWPISLTGSDPVNRNFGQLGAFCRVISEDAVVRDDPAVKGDFRVRGRELTPISERLVQRC